MENAKQKIFLKRNDKPGSLGKEPRFQIVRTANVPVSEVLPGIDITPEEADGLMRKYSVEITR